MFRHVSLALSLALALPAFAARPPASDDQRVDEDRRMVQEDNETYGIVTQVDREMHTLTVRKLGGEIVTYDFGTMNLDQDVNIGSTVRLKHDQDARMIRDVESVNLMHDVGVVTKIDQDRNTISIRQLGGEVVEYDYGEQVIDPNRIKVGERVDITHEPDEKKVLFVDLADRSLDDMNREPSEPMQPLPPPEG